MKQKKRLLLSDIWRTCNKIRAALFRVDVNIWDYFLPLDPGRNCVLSESQFVTILNGPLKNIIGLSDDEVVDLADYFRIQDGRILYTQLCEVIHNENPTFIKNTPLVTGLEWEDPYHQNPLSLAEDGRYQLIMAKIAMVMDARKLVALPYFKDYDLVAKNAGTVTIKHFSRILSYLGVLLSEEEFRIIVKKLQKNAYTVNYLGFVSGLEQIRNSMSQRQRECLTEDVLLSWPGKPLSATPPKIPRPEIGKSDASVFGLQNVFHPVLEKSPEYEDLERVIRRIQQHVHSNRIRVGQFFKDFDRFNCGRITPSQFRRCLDMIGLSGIDRMCISQPELLMLLHVYRDPNEASKIRYLTFEDDIDQVFTYKELEKNPTLKVVSPPQDLLEILPKGGEKWQEVKTSYRDLCEETLAKLKLKVAGRRSNVLDPFKDYDKHNNGHVSRSQFRQCLTKAGLFCNPYQQFALEQRYNDDKGFNYLWFLQELEPKRHEEPLYEEYLKKMRQVNGNGLQRPENASETDIMKILVKIKGKTVREGIRVMEYLREFDKHNENIVPRADFCRGLANCRFELTRTEVATIMDTFACPLRRGYVDYKRFCETVEEALTQGYLHRAPLLVPLQHIPNQDGDHNFLNFEERLLVNTALRKLASDTDRNLEPLFKDYDRTRCGTVSRSIFEKILTLRGVLERLTGREFEALMKCFAYKRGMRDEVDYRSLLSNLDILRGIAYRRPV